jgi:hypothetical protein
VCHIRQKLHHIHKMHAAREKMSLTLIKSPLRVIKDHLHP